MNKYFLVKTNKNKTYKNKTYKLTRKIKNENVTRYF